MDMLSVHIVCGGGSGIISVTYAIDYSILAHIGNIAVLNKGNGYVPHVVGSGTTSEAQHRHHFTTTHY